ncbi:MAG: CHASE2 domain-containing protein, partial [Chloroflexota bacterium]
MMGSDRDVRRTRLWIGLINGVLVAVLMLGLWSQNFLVQPRFTDWYHIGYPTTDRVVLVAIDDYTIREYGAYQDWSRERYADLLDRLVADGARVVAFDILFSEPRAGDDALEAALANAADNETRVVLAAVGFEPQPAETGNMIQFVDELRPVPAFADLAFYTAFVTTWPDRDGAIRRSPSQVQSGEQTVYNLSIASYLSFLNLSPSIASQVVTPGPASVTLPDQPPLEVAVDAQGLWLINYAGPPSTRDEGTFAVYSIRDVLENTLPPGTFDEKIVLVGLMDAEGAVDQRVTPVSGRGQPMAGVEVHANAIETLLTGIPLREEPRLSQALTIVVLSMVLSVTMARVRWPVMTMLTVALVFVWAVYASVMFSVAGIVLNPLYPIATSLFALLVSVGVRTSLEVRRRRNTESMLKTLQQVSEEQTEFERLLTLIAEDLRLL